MRGNRKTRLLLAALLCAAGICSACGRTDGMGEIFPSPTSSSAVETFGPPASPAPTAVSKPAEAETMEEDRSLAARLTGKYACKLAAQEGADDIPAEDTPEGDNIQAEAEYVTLEIFNIFGNLYAQGGFASGAQEDSSLVPDSFYGMELIPSEPEALLREDNDSCVLGLLRFSAMSNAGRYWGPPELCTLLLTEEGIAILGPEGKNQPLTGDCPRLDLRRDNRVADSFPFDRELLPAPGNKALPGLLFGLWRETDSDTPLYLSFQKDPAEYEAEGGNMLLWQKTPGVEVTLSQGAFRTTSAGILTGVLWSLGGGDMAVEWSQTFRLEGNNVLALWNTDGIGLSSAAGIPPDTTVRIFERVRTVEAPRSALFAPDDVAALRGGLRMETANGMSYPLLPQFLAAEDVENNGGTFVRVGDLVFFRVYAPEELHVSAIWGEFLNDPRISGGSQVWYYDRRTGETGPAFLDGGSGPLWYLAGRFYTQCYAEHPDGTVAQTVWRCWPDGSGWESFTGETFAQIEGISADGRWLCIHVLPEDRCLVTDGGANRWNVLPGENETIFYTGFYKQNLIYSCGDPDEERNFVLQLDLETGERYMLGELPQSTRSFLAHPEVVQLYADEEDICLGLGWFGGTARLLEDYIAVRMHAGSEYSLHGIYRGLPNAFVESNTIPMLYFGAYGELLFSAHSPAGEAALSERTYGDLLWYDSPSSETLVVEDLIPTYPFDLPEGTPAQVLQTAEYVDGAVYLLLATVFRAPEDDIGWREAYALESLVWQRVPLETMESESETLFVFP